jgi:hypothetical protein
MKYPAQITILDKKNKTLKRVIVRNEKEYNKAKKNDDAYVEPKE